MVRHLCLMMMCVICLVGLGHAAPGTAPQAADVAVCGPDTVWRVYQQTWPGTVMPAVTPLGDTKDNQVGSITLAPSSQPPAAEWASVDFDDQQWVMVRDVAHPRTNGSYPQTAGVYYRTRFGLANPAQVQGLMLTLQYRGGIVVYVNGKEVGRQDLPDGAIDAQTLAKAYPVAAFALEDPATPETAALRIRSAKITIPVEALRPGVNVLAVQSLRAPYRMEGLVGDRFLVGRAMWSTAGLVSAQLTAASPAGLEPLKRPAVRLWNAGAFEPVGRDVADAPPFAALTPVALLGPCGGRVSGQVVVSSDVALDGLTAQPGALAGPDGATIPAAAVRIRYAWARDDNSKRFAPLNDTVPPGATLVPIWITVEIPADAKAGVYTGQVALTGPANMSVPVRLEVVGWTLPDSRQWKSWSVTFQSPETLALQYKVPLWSDAHFALIEQSLAYQARLGQKIAVIHAIGTALLSRKTMVLYRQEGGQVVPDFSAVQRYLSLYQKYMGRPEAVMLVLWDTNIDQRRGVDTPLPPIPVTMREGDTLTDGTLPHYGQPGADAPWLAVVDGVKRIMRTLDWPEDRLMFGLTQDSTTKANDTAFFAEHFPDIKWIIYTHGSQPTKPLKLSIMINPGQGGGHGSGHGWRMPRGYPNITNLRGHLEQQLDPFNYRIAAMVALVEGFNGPGGIGLDYWTVPFTDASGRTSYGSIFQSGPNFQDWFRIIRGAPRTLLAPGPMGPIATILYENYLEGFQDAQALIYVDEHANDPRLPADLATRARESYDRLAGQGDLRNWRNGPGHGWVDEIARLYRIAGEMQTVLGQ